MEENSGDDIKKKNWKKNFGSSLALVIGVLSIVSFFSQASKNTTNTYMLTTGFVIIFGALAYRSAKKRKYNESKRPRLNFILELIAMAVIILLIVMQKNLLDLMYFHPVHYLKIPLWTIIAYLIILYKKKEI